MLLVAVGFALVLGFAWVFALKYITGCMVWATIALTLVILSFITGYFYYKVRGGEKGGSLLGCKGQEWRATALL